jgi:Putative peptidoglycan binding domain
MLAERSQRFQMIRPISHPPRALRATVVSFAVAALLACPCATASAAARPGQPSRAVVVEAQHLFRELGYPLGNYTAGTLGVSTRGALSYFQRKYGLAVTEEPDARTLADMRSVAAGLRGPSQPHDVVERVLGNHLPLLAIAVALACVLAVLAVGTRKRPAQDSAAEGAIAMTSGES